MCCNLNLQVKVLNRMRFWRWRKADSFPSQLYFADSNWCFESTPLETDIQNFCRRCERAWRYMWRSNWWLAFCLLFCIYFGLNFLIIFCCADSFFSFSSSISRSRFNFLNSLIFFKIHFQIVLWTMAYNFPFYVFFGGLLDVRFNSLIKGCRSLKSLALFMGIFSSAG